MKKSGSKEKFQSPEKGKRSTTSSVPHTPPSADPDLLRSVHDLDALLDSQPRALGYGGGTPSSTNRDDDDDLQSELKQLARSEELLRQELALFQQMDPQNRSFDSNDHRQDEVFQGLENPTERTGNVSGDWSLSPILATSPAAVDTTSSTASTTNPGLAGDGFSSRRMKEKRRQQQQQVLNPDAAAGPPTGTTTTTEGTSGLVKAFDAEAQRSVWKSKTAPQAGERPPLNPQSSRSSPDQQQSLDVIDPSSGGRTLKRQSTPGDEPSPSPPTRSVRTTSLGDSDFEGNNSHRDTTTAEDTAKAVATGVAVSQLIRGWDHSASASKQQQADTPRASDHVRTTSYGELPPVGVIATTTTTNQAIAVGSSSPPNVSPDAAFHQPTAAVGAFPSYNSRRSKLPPPTDDVDLLGVDHPTKSNVSGGEVLPARTQSSDLMASLQYSDHSGASPNNSYGLAMGGTTSFHNPTEAEAIDAQIALIDEREKRRIRRRWVGVAAMAIVVTVLVIALPTSFVAKRDDGGDSTVSSVGEPDDTGAGPSPPPSPVAMGPSSAPVMDPAAGSPTDDPSDSSPTNVPAASPSMMQPVLPSEPPVASPVAVTNPELFDFLVSASLDGGEALRDRNSPQFSAYSWLASSDDLDSFKDAQIVQRYVLATLYYSTDGDNWVQNEGWLSDEDECSWFSRARESCGLTGDMKRLELYYNDLEGSIPPELGLLSDSLERIDMSGGPRRKLTGMIPGELGLLTDLRELRLQDNDLTGPISTGFGDWTDLLWIDLSNNRLDGKVPTSIRMWGSLRTISFAGNDLTGIFPIGEWEQATQIYLDDNVLGGLTSDIGALRSLDILSVRNNKLTIVPTEIGLLRELRILDLQNNELSGTLHTEIGQLVRLRTLSVANNTMNGQLPSELGQLRMLRESLDLSFNDFSGRIPVELGDINHQLRGLNLRGNRLTGPVPESFRKFGRLATMWLDSNELTGDFPSEVCNVFNATLPSVFIDCLEVSCPCCNYCCVEGECTCRYLGTENQWRCY